MKRIVFSLLLFTPVAHAQVSTTVENLGYIAAQQAYNGLGFNIDPQVEGEFAAAQAVHSTVIRFDCSWQDVEKQTQNNTSGGYVLPRSCKEAIQYAKQYGQRPQLNALYGPPFQQIALVKPSSDVVTDAYTIPVREVSGAALAQLRESCFDALNHPLCEVLIKSGPQQISRKWDYPGTLITAVKVSTGELTIASATNVALKTTSTLQINQLLYAPILLTQGGPYLTDGSAVAYGKYAHFLATQIAAAGLQGTVGLYNEPDWLGGYWIHGQSLYDKPPVGETEPQAVVFTAAGEPVVSGVRYVSNFTNLSGYLSIAHGRGFAEQYLPWSRVKEQVDSEAFHPYGKTPEWHFWSDACVRAQALQQDLVNPETHCALPNTDITSNFKDQRIYMQQPFRQGGVRASITETGIDVELKDVTARFELRQYLGYQGLGVTPILFYKICNSNQNFDWVDCSTRPYKPYQQYTDFQMLMADLSTLSELPLTPYGPCSAAKVVAYQGTWPLDTVSMFGLHSKIEKGNSQALYLWQASSAANDWYKMTSPPPGMATIAIPSNVVVQKVMDMVTLQSVNFTRSGSTLRVPVADNPIEVLLPFNAAAKGTAVCVK